MAVSIESLIHIFLPVHLNLKALFAYAPFIQVPFPFNDMTLRDRDMVDMATVKGDLER